MKFSCIFPIYFKSTVSDVKVSFMSILNQSLKANEIIVIYDGPVNNEIIFFFESLRKRQQIKIIKFKKNLGLGAVLKKIIKQTKYNIIIRADSDDVNKKHRFKTLINFFKKNPKVDIVGSYVHERYKKNLYIKRLPLNNDDIVNMITYKNPINHPSVAFKKKKILECGGYEKVPFFEDYYLWFKLVHSCAKFQNINKVLVTSNINNQFYLRRSGFKYFMSYFFFLKKIYSKKYINTNQFLINFLIRFFLYNMPSLIFKFFYKYLNNRTF